MTTTPMSATDQLRFEPPGPGGWSLDTTHHGRRPVTAYLRPLYEVAFRDGLRDMLAAYGAPLAEVRVGWVHGCAYVRPMGIGEPDEPKGPPPAVLMKLLSRLHPELRRRNLAARHALDGRRWRAEVDAWFDHERDAAVAANLALQRTDLAELDDAALVEHLRQATEHLRELATESFRKHGGDLVPVGLFLAECARWGIDQADAASLLRGASPATRSAEALLAPVARAVRRAETAPESMADVCGLGDDVASAVDRWLELHGWRLVASDDLDEPTLAERPDLQLRAVNAADPEQRAVQAPDPGALRQRVPAGERALFDERLEEARYGLRQRDDAVALRWNWPAGLLRRALLEVGDRLVARGVVHRRDHAVELAASEVAGALAGEGPSGDELAARRSRRLEVEAAGPPLRLGVDAPPPPLEAMPRPMATIAGAIVASLSSMEGPDHGDADGDARTVLGTGVGDAAYRGRARVVTSSIEAFEQLEPGDVLVAPFTSSGYDSLFPIVGGVVTDEGGPVSHAAIMAREFGVPGVVGTRTATRAIPDGAIVEVDPTAGTVTVVP